MRDPNAKLQRASATARGAWEAVNAPSEASRGLFSSLRDQRKQSRRIEIALKAIGNWQKAAEEALGAAKRRRAAAETISRTCAEALLKADERLIQFEKRAGWDAKREDLDSDQDVSESDLNDGHILRGHTLESKRERPILKRLEAFKCRTGIILAEAAYARAAVKAKKARKDLYEAQKAVSLAKTERENAFCLSEDPRVSAWRPVVSVSRAGGKSVLQKRAWAKAFGRWSETDNSSYTYGSQSSDSYHDTQSYTSGSQWSDSYHDGRSYPHRSGSNYRYYASQRHPHGGWPGYPHFGSPGLGSPTQSLSSAPSGHRSYTQPPAPNRTRSQRVRSRRSS